MNTRTTRNQSDITTLSEIVQPLAEALHRYTDTPDEIEVTRSTFEGPDSRPHEAFIWLGVEVPVPDLVRAVWTVLDRTRAPDRWLNFSGADESNPCEGPILFALIQQHYGRGDLQRHSYLWCRCRDEDFDARAAAQQVAALSELLRNSTALTASIDNARIQF